MDVTLLYIIAFFSLISIISIVIIVRNNYITGQTNEAWRKVAERTGLKLIKGNFFRTPRIEGKYRGFDCILYIFSKTHGSDTGPTCTGIDIKFPFQIDYVFKISGRNLDISNSNAKKVNEIITRELKNKMLDGTYPVNIHIESYDRLHYECKGSLKDTDYILWLLDIMIELTENIYRTEGHQLPVKGI